MLLPLFRQEAIDSRKSNWLGRAQLLRPLSGTLSALLAAIIAVSVLLFLIFGEYTRRVRLSGTVQPSVGVVRLFAPQTGRLTGATVIEGQSVKAGDRLYTISVDSNILSGESGALAIQQMKMQRKELDEEIVRRRTFDHLQKKSLVALQDNMRRETVQISKQMAATMDYVSALQAQTTSLEPVVRKGFVTQRDFEDRREILMQQKALLESLRRDTIQIDARILETQAKLANFDVESESGISTLRRQISALDQQILSAEAAREILVIAPQDGIVTAVLSQPGQTVAAGAPLLSILPSKGYFEVHFFAPSSAVGFVKEGAHVLLRYSPFPYQKFGQYPGKVTDISKVSLRPTDTGFGIPENPSAQKISGLYRIRVRPDQETIIAYGSKEPLQAGMDVEADMFLETRRLYEWILEPIYSFRGTEQSSSLRSEGGPHA